MSLLGDILGRPWDRVLALLGRKVVRELEADARRDAADQENRELRAECRTNPDCPARPEDRPTTPSAAP